MGAQGPRRTRPYCFTLIELVVVILIMGILVTVGIGVYGGSVAHHRLEAAADRIEADVQLARQHAIATGAEQAIQGLSGSGRYVLPGIEDPDRPGSTYTVDLGAPPYEVTIISSDLGGDDEIRFDPFGKPDSGGSVVLGVGSRQITLTLDADTGQISRP